MLSILIEVFLLLIKQPASFFLQLWETAEAWLTSRSWKRIFLYTVPILFLGMFPGLVVRGYTKKSHDLVLSYATAFQKAVELEKDDTVAENRNDEFDLGSGQETPVGLSLGEITSRRLLQLQPGNERARFYVADGMRQKGLVLYARQVMTELAPDDRVGYGRAHAWLVNDIVESSRQKGSPISAKLLNHHVTAACLTNEVEPQMLVVHAAILENSGRMDEALKELKRAAAKDPKHWLDIARFARKSGKSDLVSSAGRNALNHFLGQLDKLSEQRTDFNEVEFVRVQAALSYSLMNEHDKAIEILKSGLRTDLPCEILRDALSNTYLSRYQSNLNKVGDPTRIGLEDVEQAMFWNPANAQVADVVSQLMAFQQQHRERLGLLLRKQISEGRGVAITHVLLANESILLGNVDAALPHLEIAFLHFPNALNVLNNLALVLATNSKPDLVRARELIEKAIKIGGESEELMDSRGQILALSGNALEAIRSYEKAIALAPDRIRTRERLVELYRQIGMQDMIAPQQQAIEDIKKRILIAEQRRQQQIERERIGREFAKNRVPLRCNPPDNGIPPAPVN